MVREPVKADSGRPGRAALNSPNPKRHSTAHTDVIISKKDNAGIPRPFFNRQMQHFAPSFHLIVVFAPMKEMWRMKFKIKKTLLYLSLTVAALYMCGCSDSSSDDLGSLPPLDDDKEYVSLGYAFGEYNDNWESEESGIYTLTLSNHKIDSPHDAAGKGVSALSQREVLTLMFYSDAHPGKALTSPSTGTYNISETRLKYSAYPGTFFSPGENYDFYGCAYTSYTEDGAFETQLVRSGQFTIYITGDEYIVKTDLKTSKRDNLKFEYRGAIGFRNFEVDEGIDTSPDVDENMFASGEYYGDIGEGTANFDISITSPGKFSLFFESFSLMPGKDLPPAMAPGRYEITDEYIPSPFSFGMGFEDGASNIRGSYYTEMIPADDSETEEDDDFTYVSYPVTGGYYDLEVKDAEESLYILDVRITTSEGKDIEFRFEGEILFKDLSEWSNG